MNDGSREPADRDQAVQLRFAGGEIEHGDGVLRAVADEEPPARLVERQAFGCAPKRSAGFCRAQIVSTTASLRVSITLSVSLPALATTSYRPLGDNAIARSVQSGEDLALRALGCGLRRRPALRSITDTEPSLAM